MMMSPEWYYEKNLKGKSEKEIRRLKRNIADNSFETEEMSPSQPTQLKYHRKYFDRALQALQEAGGQYIPTKAEQQSQSFDAALDGIQKLVFSIGGYFGGYETRTYTVSEDKVMLDMEHSFILKPSNLPIYSPLTKTELINGLKELHIGEWKKKYIDPYVLDGTQWELELFFDDRKPVKISGSNDFPYNFDDLLELLGIDEEDENDEQDQD